jgi:hypothetical protein
MGFVLGTVDLRLMGRGSAGGESGGELDADCRAAAQPTWAGVAPLAGIAARAVTDRVGETIELAHDQGLAGADLAQHRTGALGCQRPVLRGWYRSPWRGVCRAADQSLFVGGDTRIADQAVSAG